MRIFSFWYILIYRIRIISDGIKSILSLCSYKNSLLFQRIVKVLSIRKKGSPKDFSINENKKIKF